MSILGWVLLGIMAGFVTTRILSTSGEALVLDIVLGIIGAMAGGFLFTSLRNRPVIVFDVASMFVAVMGAVIVLLLYHSALGRRRRG